MKIYLLPIIFLLSVGCQPSSKSEKATDSTTFADSIESDPSNSEEAIQPNETAEQSESPIDPAYLVEPEFNFLAHRLSSDIREHQIVNELAQLVRQFEEEKYITINMTSKHPDAIGMGDVSDNETWYYNSQSQFCALRTEFISGRTTMSSLFLCKEGNLVAVSSDSEFQDEGPRAFSSVRIVSSLCPACGLNLSKEEEDEPQEYQVSEIDELAFNQYTREVFLKHEDMFANFGPTPSLKKDGERFTTYVITDPNSDGQPDTITYSIDANLVGAFFPKGVIRH